MPEQVTRLLPPKRRTARPNTLGRVLEAAAIILFGLTAHSFLSPPDCAAYWAWADTITRTLSLSFLDSYSTLDMPTRYVWMTPAQRLSNDWPPGTGLVLLPVIRGGTALAHAWVAGLALLAAAYWLRRAPFGQAARWTGLAAMTLGTPFLFYLLYGPFFSHLVSFAVTTATVVYWDRTQHRAARFGRWMVLGLLIGWAALIRPQNLMLLVLPAMEVAMRALRGRYTGRMPLAALAARLAATSAAAALAFLPYMLANWRIYGSPFYLPKLEEMHWFQPNLVESLLSDYHGVVIWTPIYVLAAGGLVVLARRRAMLGAGLLALLAIQVYLNAANEVWWAGGSFGNRRLLDCAVCVGYGVATLAAARGPAQWAAMGVTAALCAWTMFLVAMERAGVVTLDRYIPLMRSETWSRIQEFLAHPSAWPTAFLSPTLRAGDLASAVVTAGGAAVLLRAGVALQRSRAAARLPALGAGIALALGLSLLMGVAAYRTPPVDRSDIGAIVPDRPGILWDNYLELAVYRLARDEYGAAVAAAHKALAIKDDHPTPWYYAALGEYLQGRYAESAAALDECLRRNPEHGLGLRLREDLARIRN